MEDDNKMGMKSCDWKTKTREFAERGKRIPVRVWRATWRVGREDPRRVIHALKVGLALSLVSLLYLIEPLFESIGQTAIWAVMTVVVVLEFTAGTHNNNTLFYLLLSFINITNKCSLIAL